MIADPNHVRSVGNLNDSLGDAEITPHLRTAASRLIRWVGSSNYDTSETEAAGLGNPRNFSAASTQAAALADAEAYLCIASGLQSWGIVMSASGGNAAGLQAEGTISDSTFRYRNPSEIEKMKEHYIREAEIAAEDYIIDDLGGGSPGPDRSFAIDELGAEIDDDWPE